MLVLKTGNSETADSLLNREADVWYLYFDIYIFPLEKTL